MRLRADALALAAALLTAGCTFHEVDEDPRPPLALAASYQRADSAEPGRAIPDEWWRDFDEPALEAYITEALGENFDLRAAWARLRQTQQVLEQTNAALLPEVTANGEINRSRAIFGQGAFGSDAILSTRYSLTASTTYELDIWGRLLSTRAAAEKELGTSRFEVEATAQTLAGQVAETYFQLVEQRAQLTLLARQLETNATSLELLELRFRRGQASALDVLQQRQQLAATRTEVPRVERQLGLLEHQLALLLGRAPQPLETPAALPEAPPVPAVGVPMDLALRRPDLKSARDQLVAADHRINALIAERLPALRVSGQIGYSSFDRDALFDDFIGSLAASLVAPLFDGGRRAAAVEQQRALVLELGQRFAQSWLTALREVEDALHQEDRTRETIAELEAQVGIARETLATARDRYVAGLVDYLNVLSALTTVQNLERNLLTTRREALVFRVRLYRALGGAWSEALKDPLGTETRAS